MVFQSYAIWPHMTVFDKRGPTAPAGAGRCRRRRSGEPGRLGRLGLVQMRARLGRPQRLEALRAARQQAGGPRPRPSCFRAGGWLLFDEPPQQTLDRERLRAEMRLEIKELQRAARHHLGVRLPHDPGKRPPRRSPTAIVVMRGTGRDRGQARHPGRRSTTCPRNSFPSPTSWDRPNLIRGAGRGRRLGPARALVALEDPRAGRDRARHRLRGDGPATGCGLSVRTGPRAASRGERPGRSGQPLWPADRCGRRVFQGRTSPSITSTGPGRTLVVRGRDRGSPVGRGARRSHLTVEPRPLRCPAGGREPGDASSLPRPLALALSTWPGWSVVVVPGPGSAIALPSRAPLGRPPLRGPTLPSSAGARGGGAPTASSGPGARDSTATGTSSTGRGTKLGARRTTQGPFVARRSPYQPPAEKGPSTGRCRGNRFPGAGGRGHGTVPPAPEAPRPGRGRRGQGGSRCRRCDLHLPPGRRGARHHEARSMPRGKARHGGSSCPRNCPPGGFFEPRRPCLRGPGSPGSEPDSTISSSWRGWVATVHRPVEVRGGPRLEGPPRKPQQVGRSPWPGQGARPAAGR